MGTKGKARNIATKAKGRVKQTAGKASGNRRLELRGRFTKARSDLRQAAEKVKDAAKS